MFSLQAHANVNFRYEEGIEILKILSVWSKNCQITGQISKLDASLTESDCVSIFDIEVSSIYDSSEKHTIKSIWVDEWNEGKGCGDEIWVYNQIYGKSYNPQIWDFVTFVINPENQFINEVFLHQNKVISDIKSDAENLWVPFCSDIQEKNIQDINLIPQNYLIWWIIFLFLIICVLSLSLYKKRYT